MCQFTSLLTEHFDLVFDWFRVFSEISCVPRAVGVVHFSNPIGSNIPQRNEFNPKVLQATESIRGYRKYYTLRILHVTCHEMESTVKRHEKIRDFILYEVMVARFTAYHCVCMQMKQTQKDIE